jgi:hypothetical protein
MWIRNTAEQKHMRTPEEGGGWGSATQVQKSREGSEEGRGHCGVSNVMYGKGRVRGGAGVPVKIRGQDANHVI